MKKLIVLIIAGLLVITCFGCSEGVKKVEEVKKTDDIEETVIEVTDSEGKKIRMEKPAKRIISLYSAHTENLFSLDLDKEIIGVGTSDTYPPAVKEKEVFDYRSDPENIIAANPDMVLIRPFIRKSAPDFIDALEQAGINVVSLYPDELEKFDEYIKTLGMLTGRLEKADELLNDFHKFIDGVSSKTRDINPKVNVFFESTEKECRTVTMDSMPARAIHIAGGINIAEDAEGTSETSSIAAYGVEKVIEKGDKIDVYVSQKGAMNAGADPVSISKRPGFSAIKAVKEGRVYIIDEKIISSPTFRYAEGIKELADMFYPGILDDAKK